MISAARCPNDSRVTTPVRLIPCETRIGAAMVRENHSQR